MGDKTPELMVTTELGATRLQGLVAVQYFTCCAHILLAYKGHLSYSYKTQKYTYYFCILGLIFFIPCKCTVSSLITSQTAQHIIFYT